MNRRWAGVFWGLAAGAGFAMFLIGLNRAGSSQDLWPVGIADLAASSLPLASPRTAGRHGSDLLPLPGRDDHLGSGAIR